MFLYYLLQSLDFSKRVNIHCLLTRWRLISSTFLLIFFYVCSEKSSLSVAKVSRTYRQNYHSNYDINSAEKSFWTFGLESRLLTGPGRTISLSHNRSFCLEETTRQGKWTQYKSRIEWPEKTNARARIPRTHEKTEEENSRVKEEINVSLTSLRLAAVENFLYANSQYHVFDCDAMKHKNWPIKSIPRWLLQCVLSIKTSRL